MDDSVRFRQKMAQEDLDHIQNVNFDIQMNAYPPMNIQSFEGDPTTLQQDTGVISALNSADASNYDQNTQDQRIADFLPQYAMRSDYQSASLAQQHMLSNNIMQVNGAAQQAGIVGTQQKMVYQTFGGITNSQP